MDKGILSIKGERRHETPSRTSATRAWSAARRVLPPLRAARERQPRGHRRSGRNGVLEISIPKRPEATPRRIQVADARMSSRRSTCRRRRRTNACVRALRIICGPRRMSRAVFLECGMEFKDYYETLGVEPGAGEAEIKAAYRRLARKYHPDVSKEKGAEERFKAVNEAYEVLRDKDKRAPYDQLRARGYRPGEDFRPPPAVSARPAGRLRFRGDLRRRRRGRRFQRFLRVAVRRPARRRRSAASGAPAAAATRARSWRSRWRSSIGRQPADRRRRPDAGGEGSGRHPARPGDPPGGQGAQRRRPVAGDRLQPHRSSRSTAATCPQLPLAPWEAALGTRERADAGRAGGPARAARFGSRAQAAPARPRPAGQARGGRPDRGNRNARAARRDDEQREATDDAKRSADDWRRAVTRGAVRTATGGRAGSALVSR